MGDPTIRDERYRFARDRAVGFSENWAPLEWTHEHWFKHLNDKGTLAPGAVLLPSPPRSRSKKKEKPRYDGHWMKSDGATEFIIEGSKLHISTIPEGGTFLPISSEESLWR